MITRSIRQNRVILRSVLLSGVFSNAPGYLTVPP